MEQDLEADKRPESFSQLQMSQHLVAWSKVCEEVWKRQPKHIENHLWYSITAYEHIDAFPIMKSQTAWSSKDASDQVSGTYFSSDWLWLVDLEGENTLTCMDLGKMSSWSDTIFLYSFPSRVHMFMDVPMILQVFLVWLVDALWKLPKLTPMLFRISLASPGDHTGQVSLEQLVEVRMRFCVSGGAIWSIQRDVGVL